MPIKIECRLTDPQERFVLSESKFPAFVGGFGAGKSEALAARLLMRKLQYPRCNVGYFAPTFDLIRLIAWPRFQCMLDAWKIPNVLNKSANVLQVTNFGDVIFRTLDSPDRIVGFEISDAGIDELDTLKEEHARNAWNKVIARCRQKKRDGSPNTAAVATTPEGFRLVYKLWARDVAPGYELIRAPTSSNPFLPVDYVEQLRNTYPPQLLAAYLEGQFVNLTSGSVYPDFDRFKNHSTETIQIGEALHIGMDFNVYNCTAIIFVQRGEEFHAVGELTGVRDTPAMAKTLNDRFGGHQMTVYPDASGQAHKSTNASASDLSILRHAGFAIRAHATNPAVRDRIAAVNAALLNGSGFRKLKVNVRACPHLTDTLEQQVYDKNGDPDKDGALDHAGDAMGYPIAFLFPVVRSAAIRANFGFMGR